MRPITLDDPTHFRIDRFDGVELLDLLSDGFQLLRLERASLVKFHRHPIRKAPSPASNFRAWGPLSHTARRGREGRARFKPASFRWFLFTACASSVSHATDWTTNIPIEVWPNIRAALAARLAHKLRLDIRQPQIIGPVIGH